jgi:hypothetical protein
MRIENRITALEAASRSRYEPRRLFTDQLLERMTTDELDEIEGFFAESGKGWAAELPPPMLARVRELVEQVTLRPITAVFPLPDAADADIRYFADGWWGRYPPYRIDEVETGDWALAWVQRFQAAGQLPDSREHLLSLLCILILNKGLPDYPRTGRAAFFVEYGIDPAAIMPMARAILTKCQSLA